MSQVATITSKRQLTIPAAIFRKVRLSQKQKVLIVEKDGKIIITPFLDQVERLAGSLQIPRRWKGKSVDEIIEKSKQEYFAKPGT